VADLKTNVPGRRGQLPGRDAGRGAPDGTDEPAGPRGLRGAGRRIAAEVAPATLWRRHRLFAILVLLSLVPRILAALSFRPALLTADSFGYMQNAVNGKLGNIRPSGYSFFLSIFQGLPHALLVVTTLQHLMGIAVAIIVYALLRYWGLPGWGAALAAVPTLFDVREVALESYILPDTVFCLVIVVVVALLLTKRTPRIWQCVAAGLLLAYASVLRGNGIPLVVIVAAFLLIRRVGWKAFTAGSIAFVIPLLGYVLAFHSQYGKFNLTASDGIFLWSRTTSFANCAVIKPPADLLPLCPDREKSVKVPPAHSWSISQLLNAPTPADYLWASDVWWRNDTHPGIDPYNNKLGEQFAKDAIEAQPGAYLRTVGSNVLLTFAGTDRPQGGAYMTFTAQPRIAKLPSYYQRDIKAYAGTTSNTHAVYPYAFFLFLYQQPVIFPGLLFLLVVLAGLVGVARNWRRWGGIQGLPWALAAVSILSPALLTQSLYRYTIVAIPLACLAAGLSFSRLTGRPWRATASPEPLAGSAAAAGQGSAAQESPAQESLAHGAPPGQEPRPAAAGPPNPVGGSHARPAGASGPAASPADSAGPVPDAGPAAAAGSGPPTQAAAQPPWGDDDIWPAR
jgi:hypothetical protein